MSAIEVSGLTKRYGDVLANDGVSFSVEEGEVFGYLGPNGAGKTTTIRTLVGLQSPTSGTATVLGADVRDEAALVEVRERIGFLPATPEFDGDATGRQVLDLHGSIKGDSRRAELLDLFDVPVERPIRGYSTGQRGKLGLVLAFMHDPDLAVLDEPTAGLDPLMQGRFNEFVREQRQAGTTVFLSSHVLSEVRRACDRVGIVRDGRIVAVEGVEDLLGRSGKFVRLRVAGDLVAGDVDLEGVHDLSVRSPHEDGAVGGDAVTELTFTYTGGFDALVAFLADVHVLELDVEEAPLERAFARFYGGEDGDRDGDPGVAGDENAADGTAGAGPGGGT